jgi:hypothetical protein
MTTKTYSSKSNALRALKTNHPELVAGLDNATLAERHIYKGVQFRRRSVEPEGITSMVHEMFDEYQAEAEEAGKELTRKQMIARAVRDGVAYYTARTQYQKWSKG